MISRTQCRRIAIGLAFSLAACGEEVSEGWLGYVEGENALIAPPQAGWITSLEVARGSDVKIGDRLFTLDATREIAVRDSAMATIKQAQEQASQAEAQINQAIAQQNQVEADIAKSSKELQRQQNLVRSGASPQRDLDTAQATYRSDQARRDQAIAQQSQADAARRQAEAMANAAEANLAGVEFTLSERSVKSLVAGQVQDIYFRQGEYANAGVPVISVLPPANVFIRFFVPEKDLAGLKPGDRVHVGCDGCPQDLQATISFIAQQSEFTPPIIYSLANRERLVFKAEARFDSPPQLPSLRPGLPINVWPGLPIRPAAKN